MFFQEGPFHLLSGKEAFDIIQCDQKVQLISGYINVIISLPRIISAFLIQTSVVVN